MICSNNMRIHAISVRHNQELPPVAVKEFFLLIRMLNFLSYPHCEELLLESFSVVEMLHIQIPYIPLNRCQDCFLAGLPSPDPPP